MKSIFAAAFRDATRFTQAGNLTEATRLIQETLRGSSSPPDAEPDSAASPPLLELKADRGDGAEEAHAGLRRPLKDRSTARAKRPLGETIELLRRGGLAKLNPLTARHPARYVRPQMSGGAEVLTRSYTGSFGTLAYELYLPSRRDDIRGLLVMLHGCTQDPGDFAIGTGMNGVAEEHGLIVAYPAQDRAANPSLCWNWFDRKDQQRGSGEPAKIAGLTQELIAEFGVDRDRVFVAGLSAGGAMAAILAATYDDLYAAVGIHSGLPPASASDLISALAVMRGDRAAPRTSPTAHTPVRTIVFHGDADQTVHPSNGDSIVAAAKSGWNQAREEEILTARSSGGSSYRRAIVRNPAGLSILEHWTVEGMGHSWSGGNPAGSYTDPRGPDASAEMVRFFLE